MSYVYFLTDFGSETAPVKIGVSSVIERRMREVEDSVSRRLRCFGFIKMGDKFDAYKVERSLHAHFQGVALGNEWFDIRPSEVWAAVESIGTPPIHHCDMTLVPRPLNSDGDEIRRDKTGGRKPSADPSLVLTLRLETSAAKRLPKDWRAQAAEFLRGLAS